MTTHSGRSYSKSERTMEEVQTTMAQLLKALMEDQRVREQSLAEDREKREQELQEEHHRYEKVLAKWDHEMKQQMDLLKGLVETLKITGNQFQCLKWIVTGKLKSLS